MNNKLKKIAPLILKPFAWMSGNRPAQKLLEINVLVSQYLMGIGAGADTSSSGEKAVFRILKKLRPPYCIFDVGANRGQFLNTLLENVDISGLEVHCFEPSPTAFIRLSNSIWNDHRLRLNNCGISDSNGDATLFSNAPGSELASIVKRRLDHFGMSFDKTETVAMTTVDDYCKKHSIDRIHLLKLDVEGNEFKAIKGAKRMLDEGRIDLIMFELGGCCMDARTYFQDYWYFLSHIYGKQFFRITPSGHLFHIRTYEEMHEQFRTTNFIVK